MNALCIEESRSRSSSMSSNHSGVAEEQAMMDQIHWAAYALIEVQRQWPFGVEHAGRWRAAALALLSLWGHADAFRLLYCHMDGVKALRLYGELTIDQKRALLLRAQEQPLGELWKPPQPPPTEPFARRHVLLRRLYGQWLEIHGRHRQPFDVLDNLELVCVVRSLLEQQEKQSVSNRVDLERQVERIAKDVNKRRRHVKIGAVLLLMPAHDLCTDAQR